MRYASAPPFRQALEARLDAASRAGGPSLARLRKEVAFDRLLTRLVAVAPDCWILKGALALDYRFGDRARTTRDVDLAMRGDEVSATADLLAAQAIDPGDFFSFAIERAGALLPGADGAAVRYYVVAELAGRTFDEFVLDVGFARLSVSSPTGSTGPTCWPSPASIPSRSPPSRWRSRSPRRSTRTAARTASGASRARGSRTSSTSCWSQAQRPWMPAASGRRSRSRSTGGQRTRCQRGCLGHRPTGVSPMAGCAATWGSIRTSARHTAWRPPS